MRRGVRTTLTAMVALVAMLTASGVARATTGATGWGENFRGQLGNESGQHSTSPVTVKNLTEVVAVAASKQTSYALLANQTVKAWGGDLKGAFGNGTSAEGGPVPVAVSGLTEVTAIAAGEHTGLALRSNGTVWAWGSNEQGQLGQGTISGPEFCDSLSTGPCSKTPIEVPGLSEIVAIAAGNGFDMALTKGGTVYAWGENPEGQLGNGTTKGTTACVIEGEEISLGCDPTPTAVSELSEVTAIAAGFGEGVAALSNGTVRDWGGNNVGQLGNGTTVASTLPVTVTGLTGVTSVSAGLRNVSALKSNGTVWSWGSNSRGALGSGNTETEVGYSEVPVAVGGLTALKEVTAISTGGKHTLALMANQTVKAWGQNEEGQVGNGTVSTAVNTPTAVVNAKEVSSIAAGYNFSLASGGAAPVVESVSPSSGLIGGGNTVEIHGANFSEVSAVRFGNNNATSYEVVSSSIISAVVPAAGPGTSKITVTAARGTSDATVKYLYVPEGNIDVGRCLKVAKGTGNYKTGTCTETLAEANFKWSEASKVPFSGPGGEAILEALGKSKVKCVESTASGEFSTSKSIAGMAITFKKCEAEGAGSCKSTGKSEGEVTTSPLQGVLGFESKELNNPGFELLPAEAGASFMEFSCGSTSYRVRGSVVSQWTPADAMHSFFNVKFKQSKGKQKPEALEGGPTSILEVSISGGPYEQAGLSSTGTVTNAEELEINTVI